MALNTTTGIDPAVDRFVIKILSSGQIINLNATWPRTDGGAIQGGNPDYQYFRKQNGEQPQIDHRYSLEETTAFTLLTPAPAEGLPVGTYGITYTPVKRPLETLLIQIETEFQRQVRIQFPDTENPATLLLAAKALAKRQTGAVLTADETASLDAVTSVGNAVDQLVARRQELIDAATADEDYDQSVWPTLS